MFAGLFLLVLEVAADVAQRIPGAVLNDLQVSRCALRLAVRQVQHLAGEQHAGQRILEVVRNQVDQLLALAGHAGQAVTGQLEVQVGLHARQQFFRHERLGDVVHRAGIEGTQQQVAVLRGGEEDRRHAAHARHLLQCLQ